MEMIERDEFKGDYDKVIHFVKTRCFNYAAEPLIRGWNYKINKQLLNETQKQLSNIWNRIYSIRKEASYTTADIAEEVLHEVEEWLKTLFKEGKINKNPE